MTNIVAEDIGEILKKIFQKENISNEIFDEHIVQFPIESYEILKEKKKR